MAIYRGFLHMAGAGVGNQFVACELFNPLNSNTLIRVLRVEVETAAGGSVWLASWMPQSNWSGSSLGFGSSFVAEDTREAAIPSIARLRGRNDQTRLSAAPIPGFGAPSNTATQATLMRLNAGEQRHLLMPLLGRSCVLVPGRSFRVQETSGGSGGGSNNPIALRIVWEEIPLPPVTQESPPIAGPALWLRADFPGEGSMGDLVETWFDQSGNGRHFVQLTAANKPTWAPGILNDKPVVQFRSGDHLENVAPPVGFHNTTLFIVYAPRIIISNNNGVFCWAASGVNDWNDVNGTALEHLSATPQHQAARFVGANTLALMSAAGSLALDTFRVWSRVINGGSAQFWRDGVTSGAADTYSDLNNMFPTRWAIAARYNPTLTLHPSIDVAEILFYTRALSDIERQTVEAYLQDKYAL